MQQKKETVKHNIFRKIFDRSLDALSLSLSQGQSAESKLIETNYFLFLFWGLGCIVLCGIFSSFIVASALDTTVSGAFHDTKSLAACIQQDGKCGLIARSTATSRYDNIRSATEKSGDLYFLKKAIELYPPELVDPSLYASTILGTESGTAKILITDAPIIADLLEQQPPCTFDLVEAAVEVQCFPFNKQNYRLKEIFEKANMLAQELGLIAKTISKYVGGGLESQKRCKIHAIDARPMPMRSFYAVLLLMLLGGLLGGLSFVVELLYFRNRPA